MTDTVDRDALIEDDPRAPSAGRGLAWLLVIGGAIGLIAAFTLLIEKIKLLEDPSYVPSCSLNPVLSCGTIMKTDQASVFGFPNPMLGLVAFTVVVTLGVVLLTGTTLPRWVWAGLQLGSLAGIGFVAWLVFQSLYRIGALCPYCMVVWAVTIPIAFYVTVRNLRAGVIPAPPGLVRVVTDFQMVGLFLPYVVLAALALVRFWEYWSTLA